jgi:hypothetical protein
MRPRPTRRPRNFDLVFRSRRGVAWAFVLILLAGGGAALAGALTASAGDVTALLGDSGSSTDTVSTDTVSSEPTSTADATTTEATEPPGTTEEAPPPPPTTTSTGAPPPVVTGDVPTQTPHADTPAKPKKAKRPAEENEGAGATIWLNRPISDPTPPARRLARRFARQLLATSRQEHTSWALVLAVLRAEGAHGRTPAHPWRLQHLAARLHELGAHSDAAAALRTFGRGEEFVQQVLALARYNRAVGLRTLVSGLEAAKSRLERRILRDSRITIYPAGRADLLAGRVDVRVVVLIRYLRVAFGQVSVTSLISGHRLYARPNVVSAHIYGLAVDVSTVGAVPIVGNQGPGGITEHTVEAILRLPAELQPQQVISLLGLGGPSFPLADHFDHIHVGYW